MIVGDVQVARPEVIDLERLPTIRQGIVHSSYFTSSWVEAFHLLVIFPQMGNSVKVFHAGVSLFLLLPFFFNNTAHTPNPPGLLPCSRKFGSHPTRKWKS